MELQLSLGEVGHHYQVLRTSTESKLLSERLAGLGMHPGARVQLTQKRPSFVLKVEQTEVALDRSIADKITVIRELFS